MAYVRIEGQVVSQPLIIANEREAVVILVVKTGGVCKELYYQHVVSSVSPNFAAKFVRTKFSLIALSAIGDHIEAGIWSDGEIDSFENKTQARKW